MNLDPMTVLFDFVNPLLTFGNLRLQSYELRLNKPRDLCTLRQ